MSEINAILFAVLAALIVAMTSVAVRIGTEKSRPSDILAVVVIVENGESGSSVAAPIAMKLIEQYQKEELKDV